MAKVTNNIFVRGLSGSVGDQFVIRTTRSGKTIIANKPAFDDNRQFTERQLTQQEAFREATTYAKFAKTQDVYVTLAKGTGGTAYNLAVSDWFGTPKVLEINVDAWTGEVGQTIRVKAKDNVLVAGVSVVIRDANQNVLEAGEAVRAEEGGVWWNYTTQTSVSMEPFPIVEAIARDLPGNQDSFVIS